MEKIIADHDGKLMEKHQNPPFHFAIFGVFLIIGLLIYIADFLESNAIASNPQYVDGVVMCEYPYHWKGMDFICFQYRLGDQLYVGNVVAGGVMENAFEGQMCSITYDGDNPKNSKVVGLVPQIGELVSPAAFQGEVIFLDGGCSCD